MTSKFEETRQFNKSYDEIFLKSVEAIKISGFKVIKTDKAYGVIEAKNHINFKSWGENISVKINQDGNVFIRSICAVPTTIVDWGKNKENVARFWAELYSLLMERQEPLLFHDSGSSKLIQNALTPSTSISTISYKILREFDIEEDIEVLSVEELPLDNRFGSNVLTLEQEFSKNAINEISFESIKEEQEKLNADIFKILQAELTLNLSKKVGYKHGESITCRYTTTINVNTGDYIIYKITWKRKVRRSKYEIIFDNQHYIIPSVARYGVEYEITSIKPSLI